MSYLLPFHQIFRPGLQRQISGLIILVIRELLALKRGLRYLLRFYENSADSWVRFRERSVGFSPDILGPQLDAGSLGLPILVNYEVPPSDRRLQISAQVLQEIRLEIRSHILQIFWTPSSAGRSD